LADQGWFVVAGKIETGSGHVCVIVSGEMSYSTSWGTNVPCAMDTGRNKRHTSEPLSKSWLSEDKEGIEFFVYK